MLNPDKLYGGYYDIVYIGDKSLAGEFLSAVFLCLDYLFLYVFFIKIPDINN